MKILRKKNTNNFNFYRNSDYFLLFNFNLFIFCQKINNMLLVMGITKHDI